METSSVNGLCRCCASQGAFKDIKTSYHWMGEEEVYSDMMRECFDVNLVTVEQGGICELCITQLRNAANFKKQVLETEAQFKQQLRNKGLKLKEEISGFDDNDSDDMDNGDDEDYVPEFEVPIKTETVLEEKQKKRAAKTPTTRAKKSKSSDGEAAVKSFLSNIGSAEVKKEVETNWGLTIKKVKSEPAVTNTSESESEITHPVITRLNFRLKNNDADEGSTKKVANKRKYSHTPKTKLKMINVKIAKANQVRSEITESIAKKTAVGRKSKSMSKLKVPLTVSLKPPPGADLEFKKSLELDKHRYNIRMILNYSNATPIRAHYMGNGYGCCFCKQFFPKAADLKSHTIKDHDRKEKTKFMQRAFLSLFVVKLDITELCCSICKTKLETLDNLIAHFKENHNKVLYTDIKSQTICFKLDNEELKCMFCKVLCSSFKQLLEHMNQHYRNWVCDICDAGFVTQRMLSIHNDCHKQGEFQCDVCKKMFDKLRSLRYHLRQSHSGMNRYKCYQCHEKFGTIKIKKAHMIEVHGAQFAKIPCLACDKIFRDKNGLRIHTKRDHLMERRFQCTECAKSFYTNALLKNHMVIHSGVREFKCEVCGRDFARKKTLQTHMRTHREDTKFICQICQKVFYTQASLDSHAQTHALPRQYSCEDCALAFYELPALQDHMITVHGEITLQ